jgi:hypothetical protein
MMRHLPPHFCRRFRCDDIHATIDLKCICANDLGVTVLSELYGKLGLANAARADDEEFRKRNRRPAIAGGSPVRLRQWRLLRAFRAAHHEFASHELLVMKFLYSSLRFID